MSYFSSTIFLLNTIQHTVSSTAIPPDLNTISVILSAIGVLLGIVSIALAVWLDRKNRRQS